LGVGLIGAIAYSVLSMGGPPPAAPPPAGDAGAVQTAGAPPAAPPPGAATIQSRFQRANVDLDELIAKIQDIDFDYDVEKVSADPLRPLVGPMAPARFATAANQPGQAEGAIAQFLRSITVTGIILNPNRPLAVVTYKDIGTSADASEVVYIGYTFPNTGVFVEDIKPNRVVLRANEIAVPIELKER
jgi:hypothetical protein